MFQETKHYNIFNRVDCASRNKFSLLSCLYEDYSPNGKLVLSRIQIYLYVNEISDETTLPPQSLIHNSEQTIIVVLASNELKS